MSVCVCRNFLKEGLSWLGGSKRVLEGPGESGKVWKCLWWVLGGSLEGPRIQAGLKKLGHPSIIGAPVLGGCG